MAKSKTLKGESSFYNGKKKEQVTSAELVVREAFFRATKETFDGSGIDNWSLERLRGVLDFMEQFVIVSKELDQL